MTLSFGQRRTQLSIASRSPCGHDRPVLSVSWGKCGLIAAGAGDNSVRVYAPSATGKSSDSSGAGGEAGAGAGDGGGVGSGGGGLHEVGAVVSAHDDDVNCVAWHPTDHGLLASASDDGAVKLWTVRPVVALAEE